jgi:hypothetical protein
MLAAVRKQRRWPSPSEATTSSKVLSDNRRAMNLPLKPARPPRRSRPWRQAYRVGLQGRPPIVLAAHQLLQAGGVSEVTVLRSGMEQWGGLGFAPSRPNSSLAKAARHYNALFAFMVAQGRAYFMHLAPCNSDRPPHTGEAKLALPTVIRIRLKPGLALFTRMKGCWTPRSQPPSSDHCEPHRRRSPRSLFETAANTNHALKPS